MSNEYRNMPYYNPNEYESRNFGPISPNIDTQDAVNNALEKLNYELLKVSLPDENVLTESKNPNPGESIENILNGLIEDINPTQGNEGSNVNLSQPVGTVDNCVYITLGEILNLNFITNPSLPILLQAFVGALPFIKKHIPCLATVVSIIIIIISIIQLLINLFQILMLLKPIIDLIIKIKDAFLSASKRSELLTVVAMAILSTSLWLVQTIPYRLLQPLLTKQIMVVCQDGQQVLCGS